jgi:hypothetical protein
MIRVNVAGFADRPASLYVALDMHTGMVVAASVRDHADDRKPNFLHVTNIEADQHRDMLVTEEHLSDAIAAYFSAASMGRLVIREGALRADPKSRLERDKIEERGIKYRVHPDATNAQVAMLYACYAAKKQADSSKSSAFQREFMGLIESIY